MEIATNAVLAAMLIQASTFVKNVGVPLQTPLEVSNVAAFRTSVSWNQAESDVRCYLAYKGGFEFRFAHGFINDFNTRDSYCNLQRPEDLDLLIGEVKYSEAECLAAAREVFRNLGYTNVPLINAAPQVKGPIRLKNGIVPRFIFIWPEPGDPQFYNARIEVNANRLTIDHLVLGGSAFWQKSWAITFGTTNTLKEVLVGGKSSAPVKPKRTDLEVKDVTHEYAMAYIHAILPDVSEFCSKLGPPFPDHISMEDISMGESQVAIKFEHISASLRLKSGYGVVYVAGHVWAVHAPDAYYTSPWWRDEVRESKEYLEPTRLSAQEAAEKVRHLLVNQLGLPEKPLFLDTEPVFSLSPNASATNRIRRFVLQWQRPETDEQRTERKRRQELPEMSVSAEVDAVSGDIKTLNFFHRSLERPDPKIAVFEKGVKP